MSALGRLAGMSNLAEKVIPDALICGDREDACRS